MDQSKRDKLAEIGRPYHMTPSALMRLAIDNLIAATDANGGQLPFTVVPSRQETDTPEATAAAGKGGN